MRMTSMPHAKSKERSVPVGPAIAPAVISRGPVFQPKFKNLKPETMEWETPWAVVTVTGRLGGIHRKVLDAIFASALKTSPLAPRPNPPPKMRYLLVRSKPSRSSRALR